MRIPEPLKKPLRKCYWWYRDCMDARAERKRLRKKGRKLHAHLAEKFI